MHITSWLSAHSTVLLKLLTDFFQMIHGFYGYFSVDLLHPPVKIQLNDIINISVSIGHL